MPIHARPAIAGFVRPGRLVALIAAALVMIGGGVVVGYSNRASCSGGDSELACPTIPVGPHGRRVSDLFAFAHQPMGDSGSITVRLTSLTGIITYPAPDHGAIVGGVVPWAKVGIIIKDGTRQGSSYVALMVTGAHGVRMQYDYGHDIAGRPGGTSPERPRWLRLTRSGDTVTGYESVDGRKWLKVGTVRLAGLPDTVQVGMFATSPDDLTVRRTALGAGAPETRFTQVTGVFDNVAVTGAAGGGWRHTIVGELGHTDWEKHHRAPGVTESDGTVTVTGSGDVGPLLENSGYTVDDLFIGLVVGVLLMIVVGARYARVAGARRSGAVLVGAAAFVTGLVATAATIPLGSALLASNGITMDPLPALTTLRVVVGAAALLAVAAVFGYALAALARRPWLAIATGAAVLVMPYLLAVLPLFPKDVADWLLRITPAAGFAVQQTAQEYPQVVHHYAPSGGYYPLPWWAGLGVLCLYTVAVLALARRTPENHGPER